MIKKLKTTLSSLLLVATSTSAFAYTNIGCSGIVRNVYTTDTGVVVAAISYDGSLRQMDICNIDSARKGISPEVCADWSAKLTQSYTNQSLVEMWFTDTDSDYTCATLPRTPNSLTPSYVRLI